MRRALSIAAAAGLLGISHGQPKAPLSYISDWTDKAVVFTESPSIWAQLQNRQDPRYWRQLLRNQRRPSTPQMRRPTLKPSPSVRDWSFSLGSGTNTMSLGHIPAKFVFDVTAAPSCTNDFVVTGTGLAGTTTQASIVGLNNLYTNPSGTGSCTGTGPSVLFSYNLSVTVRHAAVMALDGKKIAFVDTAGGFHVLKWATGAGNGTSISSPVVPGTGNTAVDTKITLATGIGSPFIDYTNDVAYVTTGSGTGLVRKVINVFNGTPTEVTTGGWPVSMPVTNLSTPVLDFVTKRLFVNGNGTIYYIDTTAANVTRATTTWAFATATVSYPVTIDSTNQKIYAWSTSNGTNAVFGQSDTALSTGSRVPVTVGSPMTASPLGGDFNNAYYTGSSTTARLYLVGNDSSTNVVPSLFAYQFDSAYKLNATPVGGPLRLATNAASLEASFVTGFYNSTQNKDYMFVGVTNNCSTTVTSGCVRSIDVTSGFPTTSTINNVILGASGGSYGIAVDNNSSAAEASSVYYVVRTTNTLVKATQAALQ